SERLGQQLGRQLGTVPEHVDQRLVQARGHAGDPSRGRRPHRRLSTAPAVVHSTAGPPGSGVACPPVAGSDTAVPSSAGGARSLCAVIASGWVATARFRYGCTVRPVHPSDRPGAATAADRAWHTGRYGWPVLPV